MAHIRQEVTLGTAGGFRSNARCFQLCGPAGNSLFKVIIGFLKFLFRGFDLNEHSIEGSEQIPEFAVDISFDTQGIVTFDCNLTSDFGKSIDRLHNSSLQK